LSDIPGGAAPWSFDEVLALAGRMLGWGVLGAGCGLLLGLANGIAHLPAEEPGGDPVGNEWWMVGIIIFMIIEAIAGAIIGAGIAFVGLSRSSRRRAFVHGLIGAFLGLVVGCVLARGFHIVLVSGGDGAVLPSNLITQAAGAAAGMAFAARDRSR
jgi:hypothetical protein